MIVIRTMQQKDIEKVMAIEQVVCEFPWTSSIYSDCIKVGYSCWVLEEKQEILGYGLLSVGAIADGLMAAAANEAHILNLCVHPDRQHQGLGRKMMQHLIQQAKNLYANSVYLEVRLSNKNAFALYTQLGFEVVGRRKDYYPAAGGREDALVLELHF